jgi:hypothetical protein
MKFICRKKCSIFKKYGTSKIKLSDIKKNPARFKVKKDLRSMSYEDAPPFIKEKIDKGRKIIREYGLPKEIEEAIKQRSQQDDSPKR